MSKNHKKNNENMTEKKDKNSEKGGLPKIGINWYITCYDKLLTNPYK